MGYACYRVLGGERFMLFGFTCLLGTVMRGIVNRKGEQAWSQISQCALAKRMHTPVDSY